MGGAEGGQKDGVLLEKHGGEQAQTPWGFSLRRRGVITAEARLEYRPPLLAIIALCTLNTRPCALPALHSHRLVFK